MDCWNDSTMDYGTNRVVGSIKQPIQQNGFRQKSALQDCIWDLIIIQQVSKYSNQFDLWEGRTDGGYLDVLLDTIKHYQPNAKIGICMTHSSYSQNNDTNERFLQIVKTHKEFCKKYGIDILIPYGTAVQNIRESSINKTEFGFSFDKHHLSEGVGRYVASAAYFETLLAPRYGVSILGNTYRCEVPASTIEKAKYPSEFISVTDFNAEVCQMAAVLAVKNMFEVTNPDSYSTNLEQIEHKPDNNKKLIDNHVVIEHNGHLYNCAGSESRGQTP